MRYFLSIACCLSGLACTDGGIAKLTAIGYAHNIKCYSGGVIIYDGNSTGKVTSEEGSDGYFFKEERTGSLKEVSGNCIITKI